jgi:hypothetical protein
MKIEYLEGRIEIIDAGNEEDTESHDPDGILSFATEYQTCDDQPKKQERCRHEQRTGINLT